MPIVADVPDLEALAWWIRQRGERVVYMVPIPDRWPPSRRKELESMVRPVMVVWEEPQTQPPTPGELLAEAMKLLPALPPTAGGLCPPQKA